MTVSFRDYPRGRVLLMGTGSHLAGSQLPDVPAVHATLTDLQDAFVTRCGMPAGQVRVLYNPASPVELGEAIVDAAEHTEGLLLLYYVGHGLVSPSGKLHLATTGSSCGTRLQFTALSYDSIRECVFECPAEIKVVVLDCCFSGCAVQALTVPAEQMATLAGVSGAFVLTSAGREEFALARPNERHTAFSGALLGLLNKGSVNAPPRITLNDVYHYLSLELPATGCPKPRRATDGHAGTLIVTDNRSYQDRRAAGAASTTLSGQAARAGVCPYKGLAAFDAGDEQWFFGREQLTETLVESLIDRYHDARPLAVLGASGAGKTSLLKAGLLPALSRGALRVESSATWPRIVLTPTARPVTALATQVASIVDADADQVAEDIWAEPGRLGDILRSGLDRLVQGVSAPHARVVVVVDQFEEVFTQCDAEPERRLFIQALCEAAGASGAPSALVVFGMRAEFYGHCANYPELDSIVHDSPVVVRSMSATEIREVIERPAQKAGLVVERQLVESLLDDLGVHREVVSDRTGHGSGRVARVGAYEAGRLPLLSHALWATWSRRDTNVLTVRGYVDTGRIQMALANTADRIMARLDAGERDLARRLLLRLIHVDEGSDPTRCRVDRQQLLAGLPEGAARVLDTLAGNDARLVTTDSNVIEITHDALLAEWPTLQSWIREDRAHLVVEQKLRDGAKKWDEYGRSPGDLFQGSNLALLQAWASEGQQHGVISETESAFLEACLRRDRRRKQARVGAIVILIVLLLSSLVGAGAARRQWRIADEQQKIATSRSLLFQADSLRASQPATALRLAIAAYRINPAFDTRSGLTGTVLGNRYRGSLTGHRDRVNAVAFSSDGKTLATASEDKTVLLWDLTTSPQPIVRATLAGGHTRGVFSVAFSPDGHTLASGGADNTVVLWDLTTSPQPTRRPPITAHVKSVFSVAFSPDGHTLASGSADDTVTLWDVGKSLQLARRTTLTSNVADVSALAFSPDSRTLVTSGTHHTTSVWSLSDPTHPELRTTLTGHSGNVLTAAFSPDGRSLATGSADHTGILWNLIDPAHPDPLTRLDDHGAGVNAVAFSPDNRILASGSADNTSILWDVTKPGDPAVRATLPDHNAGVSAVAFSPGGRILATASADYTAILWDVADPAHPARLALAPLSGHNAAVNAVAFSPDGHTLATGGGDNGMLWDITDPKRPTSLAVLRGHTNSVNAVAFSPDGRTLATGSADNTSMLWDITDRKRPKRTAVLRGHTAAVHGVAFSPDGRTLATGSADSTCILWDITDRSHPRSRPGLGEHAGFVYAVAFSPDGHTLATASWDGTCILWDITDPSRPVSRITLRSVEFGFYAVGFGTKTGQTLLATGSADQTLTLFDVTDSVEAIANPLKYACSVAGPGLSESDWRKYVPGLRFTRTCP